MQAKISTIRIIGGKWRSRKISFIPLKGLRPTTDSARETLFNWLAPVIVGANCLDLFAGSGALGFEAVSRGAKHAVMTDAAVKVVNKLRENAKALLAGDSVDLYLAKVPQGINKIPKQVFDIIFMDPPFGSDLIEITCNKLLISGCLKDDTLIYIEAERSLDVKSLIPATWQILREKTTGLARSYLLQVSLV